jgi:hypothetical protein
VAPNGNSTSASILSFDPIRHEIEAAPNGVSIEAVAQSTPATGMGAKMMCR